MTWRCRARERIETRLQFFQFGRIDFRLLILFYRIADAGEQAGLIERLLDEIEGADLDGGDRHIDVAVPGDQDNRRGQTSALQTVNQVEAGHAGHSDVRNDAIKPLSALDRGQKFFRGRKARCFNVLTGEIETQRIEHRLIVVNDRDVNESAHAWAVFAMGSVKWTAPPCEP